MNNRRNKKEKPSSKREKVGFYIAFSLCLAAVGMSVWSAYSGVSDFFKENGDTSNSVHQQDITENVDNNLTDITEETTAVPETTKKTAMHEDYSSPTEQTEQQGGQTEEAVESFTEPEEPEQTEESTEEVLEEDIIQTILRVNKNLGYPTESGIIGKVYSENMVYDSTMRDYRAHMGIDFTCEEGEKIIAMCDAEVKEVYSSEMMGGIVEVTSGEFSILYCGLDENIPVNSGDSITKGQEIGTALGVPCESADGTHIHVEIIVRNRHIDPLSVIENES